MPEVKATNPTPDRRVLGESSSFSALVELEIDVDAWRHETQERFETGLRNLLRMKVFIGLSDEHPEEKEPLTDFFHQEADRLKKLAQGAKKPLIHLIFSRDPDLSVSADKVYAYSNPNAFMNRLSSEMRASGYEGMGTAWDGTATVDFTQREDVSLPPEDYVPSSLETLILHDRNLRHQVILIIDGYGKDAIERDGFWMADNCFGAGGMLARVSLEQAKKDSENGSWWLGKGFTIANMKTAKNKHGVLGKKYDTPSFDTTRFECFAAAIDQAVASLKEGASTIGVRAPNGYGKSTALEALAILRPITIGVAKVDEIGCLVQTSRGQEDNQSCIQVLLVDEAGREEIPNAQAKQELARLKQQGVKIVRIYPGNVKPPEGLPVIEIEG